MRDADKHRQAIPGSRCDSARTSGEPPATGAAAVKNGNARPQTGQRGASGPTSRCGHTVKIKTQVRAAAEAGTNGTAGRWI